MGKWFWNSRRSMTRQATTPQANIAASPGASFLFPTARRLAAAAVWLVFLASFTIGPAPASAAASPAALARSDHRFLDELERAAVLYFWEASDPETGLTKDRARAGGNEGDARRIGSIAATGFGLTGLCIADQRRYLPSRDVRARVRATLRFLRDRLPQEHGYYFHFIDVRTGERIWKCELSSIDTALLLCGVLTCRQYFRDEEIRRLATEIYERVDWPWMLNGGGTFSHGWKPESGFLRNRWDHYCELMMLYLLALGSPTHPVPPETWSAWDRPWFDYEGYHYINPKAPLFVHQYSQAWFDFRGRQDRNTNYFDNSIAATRAHRQFCLNLRGRFPVYSEDLWGISASDSAHGYTAWGGPPELGQLDGSVVPCAAAGSIPFLPRETLRTLRFMRRQYGDKIWKRYGFVDAFNPTTSWYDPDVIGIDVGITLLMAENARTGFVWKTFMKNLELRDAMDKAGFQPSPP
jgi:hypothetical protein